MYVHNYYTRDTNLHKGATSRLVQLLGAIDICSTDHKEAFHHIQLTAHVEKPRDLCDKFAAQEHAFEDLKLRERKSREQLKSLTQEMEGAKV